MRCGAEFFPRVSRSLGHWEGLKGNGIIEELEVFSAKDAKAAFLEGMSPGPLKGKPEIDQEMR